MLLICVRVYFIIIIRNPLMDITIRLSRLSKLHCIALHWMLCGGCSSGMKTTPFTLDPPPDLTPHPG